MWDGSSLRSFVGSPVMAGEDLRPRSSQFCGFAVPEPTDRENVSRPGPDGSVRYFSLCFRISTPAADPNALVVAILSGHHPPLVGLSRSGSVCQVQVLRRLRRTRHYADLENRTISDAGRRTRRGDLPSARNSFAVVWRDGGPLWFYD